LVYCLHSPTFLIFQGFKDYVDHFIKGHEDETGNQIKATYEQCGERWEVAVAVSDNGFQQVKIITKLAEGFCVLYEPNGFLDVFR